MECFYHHSSFYTFQLIRISNIQFRICESFRYLNIFLFIIFFFNIQYISIFDIFQFHFPTVFYSQINSVWWHKSDTRNGIYVLPPLGAVTRALINIKECKVCMTVICKLVPQIQMSTRLGCSIVAKDWFFKILSIENT